MTISTKRRDLLHTAETLFYTYGFHAVGMKRIIKEANVATMTLYNHFDSKDQLIEEVLKQCEIQYWSYLNSYTDSVTESIFLQVVKGHGKWMKEKGKNGCMFLRAMEEFANENNQIEQIVKNHKSDLLQFFQSLAKENGIESSEEAGLQLMHVVEGSTSMAEILSPEKAEIQAINMVKSLLELWEG